jgi:hypothetical protein
MRSSVLKSSAHLLAAAFLAVMPLEVMAQEAPFTPPLIAAPESLPLPPAISPGGVEVQSLQTLDLFSGGLGDTGLPSDLWNGSSARIARDLIPSLGAKPLSPAAKSLARRLLATAASAPDGAGSDQALAAARTQALLTLGDARAAAATVERMSNIGGNAELSQAAAESALILGADEQACLVSERLTVDRGAPYWLKLRAYCQAISGQTDTAAVTLSLATAGGKEPVFARLMSVLLASAGDPGPPSLRSGVDYALSRRLSLDLTAARASATPAISSILFGSDMPTPDLDITASLANLRRAKTIEAFTAAARVAAPLIQAQAMAGAPLPDGVLLSRASLAAGDIRTAQIVRQTIAEAPPLDLALLDAALAAAAGRIDAQTFDRLVERGATGAVPAQSGALLLSAFGGALGPEARGELAGFTTPRGAALPGRLLALELAAQAGAKGETALLALSISDAGAAPADRSRAVRALSQAGLTDDARAMAIEGLVSLGIR